MSEAWFTPGAAQYFALASVLSLTALATPLIARGKHRALIVNLWRAILAAGLALFAAGVWAYADGQPPHVTLPLLAAGLAMAGGFAISLYFVTRAYRSAEQRKIAAREL